MLSSGENRLRAVLALVLAAVSVGCLIFGQSRPVFYAGYASAVFVALLLGPAASLAYAKLLRPLLKLLRPVEGALAADSLILCAAPDIRPASRQMMSLALSIAFSGMQVARASYNSIIEWMDSALNPDLFVTPSQDIVVRSIRFPPEMGDEIASVPGVRRVQKVRSTRVVVFRVTPIMVVSTELR